ncbi:YggS family pyridoxal phosphate-dependent enzyme [Mobilitalea sibirica]|uniref:Pyridoxal phosphate homeostasis protein n=1 Tax=Mobilitalea sibirica TaxID=1462919 RepID=A0A8J7KT15_9FIRM|nr:YggS family pyridoxal phosphate-dependent enzyme [Mobilitalea sibirica]MBH1940881.1 YggS family pyridoxal phosphate-dependent enzyme [Mobilitalea sibirica]
MLKDNLLNIEQRIQAACDRSGRKRSEVTLIAVSKTKPISMIKEAYEAGMRHFGENKVQELVQKYDDLTEKFPEEISWHMIGHLQRNKVKYIVDKAVLIHSVDSLRLALQIEEEAAKKGIVSDILIEVNIADEDTKFGVSEEEVFPLLNELLKLPHVRVRGLMTIAPFVVDSEKNRKHFRKLHELFIDIKTKNIDNKDKGNIVQDNIHINSSLIENSNINFDNINTDEHKRKPPEEQDSLPYFNILSMGMTGDFEVAIEEGATMVRVGTGIFGERSTNIPVSANIDGR